MNVKIYALIILFFPLTIAAQNLAPNPSFENYDACPVSLAEILFPSSTPISLADWSRPTESTSDYFNACNAGGLSVPNNIMGPQVAHTGDAYVGYVARPSYTGMDEYREYVQARLSSPLIAGHRYYVSYWISLGEWFNIYELDYPTPVAGVDGMGAYFGMVPEERVGVTDVMDDLVPQILSPAGTPFSDTANWMPVSGEFIADGGEEWVIIGNFYGQADLAVEEVVGAAVDAMCYYFLDDVCVLDMDGLAGSYTITDTAICSGEHLTFEGRNGEGITYLWDNGSVDLTRNITVPGTYWVKSIDINNCSIYADSFYVGQKVTTFPIDLGADTVICANLPLILNAGNDLFTEYKWNTGANAPSIEVNTPGQYYVTANAECYTGSDTIVLYAAPLPEAILPSDTILCKGIAVALQAKQPGMMYSWSTGDNTCCIEVTESGTYELVVSNICEDKAVDEIKIIYSGCDNCILIPNAFSPNNDGLNDKFEILVNCVMSTYKLNIFNRWGQLVFSSAKPGNNWDGTYKGQVADMGVYYYSIEASPVIKEAGKVSEKGEITLIR